MILGNANKMSALYKEFSSGNLITCTFGIVKWIGMLCCAVHILYLLTGFIRTWSQKIALFCPFWPFWRFFGFSRSESKVDDTIRSGMPVLFSLFFGVVSSLIGVLSSYHIRTYARAYSWNLRQLYLYCLKEFLTLNWLIWYIFLYYSDATLCWIFHYPVIGHY